MLIVSKDFLDKKSKYIIDNLEDKLRKKDVRYFIEYHMVGEEKVAYEDLCTQIHEFDVKIPKKVFDVLKEMCLLYDIEEYYWKNLEDLIVD